MAELHLPSAPASCSVATADTGSAAASFDTCAAAGDMQTVCDY